jgi:uncharacterized repeat protein (TIGR02543 family)
LDTNLQYSTTYYYQVWAYNAATNSPLSNIASFTTPSAPNTNNLTVSIVSPTANEDWSNSVFTVSGQASDNMGVAEVYYSLNGSGWTNASTGNGWTNWTANLTLTPGTNTIAAYAVDTSDNVSATDSVSFVYVLTAPLTVLTNGNGMVSPNYNGDLLQIGQSYSMTASAAAGFAFTGWTGSLTTNGATLKFTMASNLTFTANFVDTTKPVVSIVSPTANEDWSNSVFTVTGTVKDNVPVSNVFYSLNSSGWTNASTGNGWTNWTANLTLTPGTNTIAAYAVDTSDNVSATDNVSFVYVLATPSTAPLTVLITGNGTVSPNYNGVMLHVGVNYEMSAQAGSGFAFTNWTGSLTTNHTKLKFKMSPNLTFKANFVDMRKPTVGIVSPKANEKWSNSVFTVSGKADDNVAVANVYYSLNGSGWTNASFGNGWTNWTANLTLVPGTNTIAAYSVATSGNVSTTNKVNFLYVVPEPLNVQVNGLWPAGGVAVIPGKVSPTYNGAMLDVGVNYEMSAKAESGFAFTNWTGSWTTNEAKLRFRMTTNLTFTANFVDVQKPTVSIVSPKANEKWSNSVFTVSGKAGDNVAVSNVLISLNNGAWTRATLSNGGSNWTANLTLIPGPNTIAAYAVDTSGNVSATDKVSFVYVLTAPLTVLINGNGTVSPNYNGAQLQIGENYSMTARAKAGFGFTNWTGSWTTNGATLKFTMASNLTFTANFVTKISPRFQPQLSKSQLSVQILPPEISDLSVGQGMATISFESTTGLLYTLESKDSLTDTNWTTLPVSIIGTGGGVSLTDSNAPPACRFYRVRAQAAP